MHQSRDSTCEELDHGISDQDLPECWDDRDEFNSQWDHLKHFPAQVPIRNHRRKKKPSIEHEFNMLPEDIWHLIGKYIDPTAVANFALICQASHQVTHTANFWFTLYKRHFRSSFVLPAELQPVALDRVFQLRSKVIRALHIMCSPWCESRMPRCAEMDASPTVGRVCNNMWFVKDSDTRFTYYFRFAPLTSGTCSLRSCGSSAGKLLHMSDVFDNPDEGCMALQVKSNTFAPLSPGAIGLRVEAAHVLLSRDLSHFRVVLTFSGGSGNGATDKLTLTMDPVLSAQVTHWWHPLFPR